MITNTPVAARGTFGDLVVDDSNPDRPIVTNAPDLTRIRLSHLANSPSWWSMCVDDEGIRVAGTVWYRPIEVTPDGLTLICQKIRDTRPLMQQSREEVTRRGVAT